MKKKRKSKYREISKVEIAEIEKEQEEFREYFKKGGGGKGNWATDLTLLLRFPSKVRRKNPNEPRFFVSNGKVFYP